MGDLELQVQLKTLSEKKKIEVELELGMVEYIFNPRFGKLSQACEFQARQGTQATQWEPVLKMACVLEEINSFWSVT